MQKSQKIKKIGKSLTEFLSLVRSSCGLRYLRVLVNIQYIAMEYAFKHEPNTDISWWPELQISFTGKKMF